MADPVSALLALGMLALYPATAVGTLLWHQASEGRRAAIARRDWGRFAASRGLAGGARAIGGGAFQLAYAGTLRGRSVAIEGQTSKPVQGWTAVRALLQPPLDLGVYASPDTVVAARRLGAMSAAADEPERSAALFDPTVRALLQRLETTDWILADFGVVLRYSTLVADPRGLGTLLDQAVELVDAVDRARARIRPAGPLAAVAVEWKRLAEARGLAFFTSPLAIVGAIDGIRVSAFARRTQRLTFGLGAEAHFARPLGGNVGLIPTAAGAVAPWLGVHANDLEGEDWALGDAAFDAAFVVRSRRADQLPRILGPDLRARLLAMHERTPLLVDDHCLRVAAERLPHPESLPSFLAELAALAGEIEQRAHGASGSPYR